MLGSTKLVSGERPSIHLLKSISWEVKKKKMREGQMLFEGVVRVHRWNNAFEMILSTITKSTVLWNILLSEKAGI